MIDVVDEELNLPVTDGVPKYYITDENNTTTTAQIDLATPVVTPGTPLNRALAVSIKNHLDLISRYWGFVGAEQGNYTNPNLTDSARQGYTISITGSDSSISAGLTAYDLFNTNTTTGATVHGENTSHYIQFNVQSPVAIKLNTVRMRTKYNWYGWKITVKGSNDNSTWTTLLDSTSTVGGGSEADRNFAMTNSSSSYTYFTIRLQCNSANASTLNIQIRWLQLIGYIVTDNSTENPLPEFIGVIEEGQRLYVKTIPGYVMYNDVDYNLLLGGIMYPLPKTLSANTKYTLVYDGEKFVTEANY